jgi:hypothetical protein
MALLVRIFGRLEGQGVGRTNGRRAARSDGGVSLMERYANCTVSYEMHSDRRFDLLAELAGWSRAEACWRMVELWARCTALQTDRPPAEEIRIHLGICGEQFLVDATLGQRCSDGSVRVLGGGLSGGDTDRFGWFAPVARRGAAGGLARRDRAVRDQTGKFVTATANPARSSEASSVSQQVTSKQSSEASKPPASYPQAPASGFRIPEEDLSRARAIPLSTATAAHTAPVPSLDAIWEEFEIERRRVATALRIELSPLTAHDGGRAELAAALSQAALRGQRDQVVADARKAIAVAGAEAQSGKRELKWFTGVIFEPRNWRALCGSSLEEARRSRAPPRSNGAPQRIRITTDTDEPDLSNVGMPLSKP